MASFLGTGWSFPPAFDAGGRQAVLVSDAEDIQQSLRILLSTTPGERVMHPSYGCNLRRLVYEIVDDNLLTEIRDVVTKAVLYFEPRIVLNELSIDTSDLYNGVLRLTLDYTIRSTSMRDNLVYPLYLEYQLALAAAAAS